MRKKVPGSRNSSMSSKDIVQNILFNQGPDGENDFDIIARTRRRLGTIADRTDTVISGDHMGAISRSAGDGTLTVGDESSFLEPKMNYKMVPAEQRDMYMMQYKSRMGT